MFRGITLFTIIFSQDYVSVTFQVDMANEIVSDEGVHIMGSDDTFMAFGLNLENDQPFPAWDPTAIQLFDEDSDNIYTVTISLLSATEYLYKFVNGNSFGQDEGSNRAYLSGDSSDILEAVCFDSLEP